MCGFVFGLCVSVWSCIAGFGFTLWIVFAFGELFVRYWVVSTAHCCLPSFLRFMGYCFRLVCFVDLGLVVYVVFGGGLLWVVRYLRLQVDTFTEGCLAVCLLRLIGLWLI